MQPYTGIDGLPDIVLEESYVLGISATPGQVVFTMDFVLTPSTGPITLLKPSRATGTDNSASRT
jgi:hypothetical protein